MNCVEFFEVEGFWGIHTVRLNLKEDINFLIGSNGSGKTTIINLLSAVLQADIPKLYSIQFSKITIRLKTKGMNRKPVIELSKKIDKRSNSLELEYTIKEKSSDKGSKYIVEGPYEEHLYKDKRYSRHMRLREEGARLNSILADFVEVNWLSVQRSAQEIDRRRYADEDVQNSVDTKIKEISSAFSKYFSLLGTQADKESASFQEHVFLSLLEQERDIGSLFSSVVDEPAEKETVVGILRDLGVAERKANRSVTSHLSRLGEAKKNLEKNSTSLTISDAVALSDSYRVNEMVKKWRHLQDTRSAIFGPRIKFEEIINSQLTGKGLKFDPRNVPKIHLARGGEVDIGALSSGEKQLFILLGEAVLQEERPVVFISDEPELSLHVNWQSSLFKNIRSLNGACQIISATHSPDIVGHFQDRVIKIEDCFL